jgi:transposase
VRRRAPLGLEAGRAQGVVPRRAKAASEGPPALRMDLPLYAFARPNSGEVHWLILPTVNAAVFSVALEHFAREVGAGKSKRVLLVLDNAGWHTAKRKLKVPEGIHLEFLPSHSPELQPAERLWALSDEAVANRYFEAIEDLQEALVGRCVTLRARPELIRSYIRYHWWPEAA